MATASFFLFLSFISDAASPGYHFPARKRPVYTFMKNKPIYYILAAFFVAGLLTIFYFNGTGDGGDSIYHYQYARYAPQHPELFFNHWAKPLFVLLSAPFAQFGFTGMKVFNLLVALLTVLLTYRTARLYGYENAFLAAIFVICAPLNYILTFSGLTEPLFALFLIGGVYLAKKEQSVASALVISLLPFIRSEGLIFAGVFGFWFLLNRQHRKAIPVLLFGHLAYSVAGYFVHHDLLWIFTKIPYAAQNTNYGQGKPDHFVKQLNFVVGLPLYILLWMGIPAYVRDWLRHKKAILSDETILILGGFLAFLVAHTLFWYLGLFHSAGLKRVFIGVMPLMALIALKGFLFFTDAVRRIPQLYTGLKVLIVLTVIIFPLTGSRSAIDFKKDMTLTPDQKLAREAGSFMLQNPPGSGVYYFSHPYLCEVLNRDCFDPKQHRELNYQGLQTLKKGDVVIWENWFAVTEHFIKEEDLAKIPNLRPLRIFTVTHTKGTSRFVIYRQE
jgi:hypothetical protein